MNPWLKNILAIIVGWIIGAIVNTLLVNAGPMVFPLPDGVDISSFEGLKKAMPLFEVENFIFPFLGHAVGTLVGAFIATKMATQSFSFIAAMIVGALFFLGGISMVYIAGGPTWFIALDLVVAYFPMAWLGWKFAKK